MLEKLLISAFSSPLILFSTVKLKLQSWTNSFGTLAFISAQCTFIFFGLQAPPPHTPLPPSRSINVGHKLVHFQNVKGECSYVHAKVYWVFTDGHHPLVVTFVRRVFVKSQWLVVSSGEEVQLNSNRQQLYFCFMLFLSLLLRLWIYSWQVL